MLMPEQTDLRDTSTCRDLYVFALLRFDVVKDSIPMYCFLLFGFTNVIFFVLNPFGYNSAFVVADLKYPYSLRHDRSS